MQLYANLTWMAAKAKQKFREFLFEESGEVNIVAIVILIGIAVLLALVFKEQITKLLNSLFGTITDQATSAIGGGGGATP